MVKKPKLVSLIVLIILLGLLVTACNNKQSTRNNTPKPVAPKTNTNSGRVVDNNTNVPKDPAAYPMKVKVESHGDGSEVWGYARVYGWALSLEGIKKVEILYNDGFIIEKAESNIERPDLPKDYPGYPVKGNGGFEYMMNTERFANGEQVFKVRATAKNGETQTVDVKVKVNNPPLILQYIPDADKEDDPLVKDTKYKAQRIVDDVVTPNMTDGEKVMALHDYLVTHVRYDEESYNKGTNTIRNHSAYEVLLAGQGTCTGYANAMALLLDTAGIENMRVFGLNKSSEKSHTWNLVKMNGKYYHVDVTWDDADNEKDNKVNYDYYRLTDRQMSADHIWDTNLYPKSQ